jgi:hypothetical protein
MGQEPLNAALMELIQSSLPDGVKMIPAGIFTAEIGFSLDFSRHFGSVGQVNIGNLIVKGTTVSCYAIPVCKKRKREETTDLAHPGSLDRIERWVRSL